MKVLFIGSDEEAASQLGVTLNHHFQADLIKLENLQKAQEILALEGGEEPESGSGVQLLIIEKVFLKRKGIQEIWEKTQNIPTVVIAPGKRQDSVPSEIPKFVGFVNPAYLNGEMTKYIQEMIADGSLKPGEGEHEYNPIRTELLIKLNPLQADIYIKLSGRKFLKLFKAGDTFNEQDLERYQGEKGIEYLYLRDISVPVLFEKFNKRIRGQIERQELDRGTVRWSYKNAHDTIQKIVQQMGVTEDVQYLTKSQVQMVVQSMQAHWKLKEIMDELIEDHGGFIAIHSLMLSYLSVLISNKTQWASETNSYKLAFASFLHDITLQNPRMAQYDSLEALKKAGGFSNEDIQNFKLHPIQALERCKQFRELPPEVETIILQHHERPDGTGFPRRMKGSAIRPNSAIFIIAQDMIYHALLYGTSFDIDRFLKSINYREIQPFKKILDAIREDFQSNLSGS